MEPDSVLLGTKVLKSTTIAPKLPRQLASADSTGGSKEDGERRRVVSFKKKKKSPEPIELNEFLIHFGY